MSVLAENLLSDAVLADSYGAVRKRAQAELMRHGFPDIKTEAWKYTSLRALEKRSLVPGEHQPASPPPVPFDHHLLHIDAGRLLSDSSSLPSGISIEPVDSNRLAGLDYGNRGGAFGWLNLARFEQGLKVVINGRLDQPLMLALTTPDGHADACHPRIEIELTAGSRACLVQLDSSNGSGLVNAVIDLKVGENARLDHALSRHNGDAIWIERLDVALAAGADYRLVTLDGGGRLTRQDINVALNASGARCEVDGSVLIGARQHVDFHTAIDHCVGGTNSRERFRMLADGNGVGVFNGRIHIHPGADDSHSDLNTGNLLLSEQARINTKPELEIHAEEVTASHGATVGQLDEQALFYLRSRGLSAEAAANLLKTGFAAAPLETAVDDAVRQWLLANLGDWL